MADEASLAFSPAAWPGPWPGLGTLFILLMEGP